MCPVRLLARRSAAVRTIQCGRAEPRRIRCSDSPAQGRPRASEFVFARLRYDSGDWDYNPKVAANVLNSVVEYTNIPVYPEEVVIPPAARNCWRFPSCS